MFLQSPRGSNWMNLKHVSSFLRICEFWSSWCLRDSQAGPASGTSTPMSARIRWEAQAPIWCSAWLALTFDPGTVDLHVTSCEHQWIWDLCDYPSTSPDHPWSRFLLQTIHIAPFQVSEARTSAHPVSASCRNIFSAALQLYLGQILLQHPERLWCCNLCLCHHKVLPCMHRD